MAEKLRNNDATSVDAEITQGVADFIGEQFKKTKHVPTIKELVEKKIVKNPKKFYKVFPGGLTQACNAAKVPVPTHRIETVKNAVNKRKQSHNQTQSKEMKDGTEPVSTENAKPPIESTDPLSTQVAEQENETVKSRSQLALLQRLEKARREDEENKKQIQTIKEAEIARKMHGSFADYNEGMLQHYRTHPELQRMVQGSFSKRGWGVDFDKHFSEIIHNQFEVSNYLDTTLPEIWRRMGVQADILAVPDFAALQWEYILEELTGLITGREFKRIETKIRNLIPSPYCTGDGSLLRSLGGSNFVCQRGHISQFPCPECRAPLTYTNDGFICNTCRGRFLG